MLKARTPHRLVMRRLCSRACFIYIKSHDSRCISQMRINITPTFLAAGGYLLNPVSELDVPSIAGKVISKIVVDFFLKMDSSRWARNRIVDWMPVAFVDARTSGPGYGQCIFKKRLADSFVLDRWKSSVNLIGKVLAPLVLANIYIYIYIYILKMKQARLQLALRYHARLMWSDETGVVLGRDCFND